MSEKDLLPFFNLDEGLFLRPAFVLIEKFGSIIEAILYTSILMPAFIEVEGSVILGSYREDVAEIFRAAILEKGKSLEEIEKGFTWVEIGYLFSCNSEGSENAERVFANRVAECWRAMLLYKFPERRFEVSVLEPEETGDGVGVGFREIRAMPPLPGSS